MWKLLVGGALAACAAMPATTPRRTDTDGTRAAGLRLGSHAVGFEVRRLTDVTRRINARGEGTEIGVAVWYPARPPASGAVRVSSLDYRLLAVRNARNAARRAAFTDDEVDMLTGWRHVGVVALTRDQARASLDTTGIAVRDAPAAAGRFPIVIVAGGPFYLSTTAEALASHGFLVAAPFRFERQSNEIETRAFTAYLENSVRDAEWALADLRSHPHADARFVGAVGHGGGGMQAMLLAMRNRAVRALVNIDAGNFSTRSEPRRVPFYAPRALRVPYLYLATAETRRGQDLFDDFIAMDFAERFEVIVEPPAVKHHDLSDIGRGVTAPLGLRGDDGPRVQEMYSDVQEMTVRFLQAAVRSELAPLRDWLGSRKEAGTFDVVYRPGKEPAPTVVAVLDTLGASTGQTLTDARARDPEAPLFQVDQLARIVAAALEAGELETADAVSALALQWRPDPILAELRSRTLERRGDASKAAEVARACAAMEATNWRPALAVEQCRQRSLRLTAPASAR